VQVTLKGEILYISQVTTVEELQERLQEESGLDPSEQGRVTFQGKVLDSSDSLSDAGMKDGDQINVVPRIMGDHWKMMREMGDGLISLRQQMQNNGTPDQEKEMAVMTNLFEDLMKVPYMQEEMERFSQHLKNPVTLERATDPERVESLRQIILNNPLLMQYIAESKSTQEAIRDAHSWLQFITASVEEWKTMDGYQLWQRLIDGKLFGG
jgi:molybdopterin converting factor small subunit